jgi:flavin reductase (DIM6/NTAB) family NADH-FMN oxidoreductase RutF
MECRLERILEIGRQPAYLILGEVLLFHVREDVVRNGRVDARALRPLARLGGSEYAALGEVFSMARPAPAPPSR